MISKQIKKQFKNFPELIQIVDRQEAKGKATYGSTLDHNNADVKERVNHALEEIIDAMMYMQWISETQQGLNKQLVDTDIKILSSIAVGVYRIGKGGF